jgi:predicted ATPase
MSFKIQDLTNEEILVVYYRFQSYLQEIDKSLEKNMLVKKVEGPGGLTVNGIRMIDEKEKQEFLASDFYKTTQKIVEKLKPVVVIIEDLEEMKEFAQTIK